MSKKKTEPMITMPYRRYLERLEQAAKNGKNDAANHFGPERRK